MINTLQSLLRILPEYAATPFGCRNRSILIIRENLETHSPRYSLKDVNKSEQTKLMWWTTASQQSRLLLWVDEHQQRYPEYTAGLSTERCTTTKGHAMFR